MKTLLLTIILFATLTAQSQTYPSFGPEIEVTINGLTFDAMEPFVSPDGNTLFFNNLNDGVDTKLYYATKVNDSTFTFVGELNGTNQTVQPHLDAVADMDSLNNFYWTSTRDYPAQLDNLHYGTYTAGTVAATGRVHGDFNKNTVGWLVMDHGISIDGQLLYYNNARFDGVCQGPCETELGIAQKVNDSTFNKIPASSAILQTVNDTNYIYYAPCISSDDLEFYYTRFPKDTVTASTLFEICVAVRTSPTGNFSVPAVLFSETIANLIEAPTLTTDKQIMYYHRKVVGSHIIVMRYRDGPVTTNNRHRTEMPIVVYPNPANDRLSVKTERNYQKIQLTVLTVLGTEVLSTTNQTQLDIRSLPAGTYFLKIDLDEVSETKPFLKIE